MESIPDEQNKILIGEISKSVFRRHGRQGSERFLKLNTKQLGDIFGDESSENNPNEANSADKEEIIDNLSAFELVRALQNALNEKKAEASIVETNFQSALASLQKEREEHRKTVSRLQMERNCLRSINLEISNIESTIIERKKKRKAALADVQEGLQRIHEMLQEVGISQK